MTSQLGAGKEVLSYCGKCKLTLAHTIISMLSPTQVGKVVCKTCGGTHKFKNAPTEKKRTLSTKTRKKVDEVPLNQQWEEFMAKIPSQDSIESYSIRKTFKQGQFMNHKQFGVGIVQEVLAGKIEVLFRYDIKTLVHGL